MYLNLYYDPRCSNVFTLVDGPIDWKKRENERNKERREILRNFFFKLWIYDNTFTGDLENTE